MGMVCDTLKMLLFVIYKWFYAHRVNIYTDWNAWNDFRGIDMIYQAPYP